VDREPTMLQRQIMTLLADSNLHQREKTLSSLAKKTYRHKNTVRYNLKRLQRKGLIKSNKLLDNPNQRVYHLTVLGKEWVIKRYIYFVEQLYNIFLYPSEFIKFNKSVRTKFLDHLKLLLNKLRSALRSVMDTKDQYITLN